MKIFAYILTFILINSCSSAKNKKHDSIRKQNNPDKITLNFNEGPQVIIYKTKKNYNKNVPVLLSDDKSVIVSYPHPSDLSVNGKLPYPTQLEKGYLLDNRGINRNVAFLNITYSEYSKLKTVPSLDKLYSMILDKDPLIEMYNCGNKFSFNDLITDLNKLILNDNLKKCKILKMKREQ